MVRVKICGITNIEDAMVAVEAGADALGLVFHEPSPRNVTPEQAAAIVRELPPFVQTVGLFVNLDTNYVNDLVDFCRIDTVQLHGDESSEYCRLMRRPVIKAIRVKDAASLEVMKEYLVSGYLLDTWSSQVYGGTGRTFDWELARTARQFGPIILAGGLTPENVAEAVAAVVPFAVDVSGGVEAAPGKKDPEKVRQFIRQAKAMF